MKYIKKPDLIYIPILLKYYFYAIKILHTTSKKRKKKKQNKTRNNVEELSFTIYKNYKYYQIRNHIGSNV